MNKTQKSLYFYDNEDEEDLLYFIIEKDDDHTKINEALEYLIKLERKKNECFDYIVSTHLESQSTFPFWSVFVKEKSQINRLLYYTNEYRDPVLNIVIQFPIPITHLTDLFPPEPDEKLYEADPDRYWQEYDYFCLCHILPLEFQRTVLAMRLTEIINDYFRRRYLRYPEDVSDIKSFFVKLLEK